MSPSPIRCRGPWKIHKRSSEPDRWLDEMGFFRKHTARDSSCLFRAVSENIYNTQRYYHKVRLDCVQFMATKRNLFEGSLTCSFENYLNEMSNPSEWAGLIEISAMSHLYRRDFVIFEANKGPQTKICNGYGNPIYLFYSPDTKHFDVVYSKDFINTSSFCQCNITRKGLTKARKPRGVSEDKTPEKLVKSKVSWTEESDLPYENNDYTYQQLDYLNFESVPIEVDTLPLMVDGRPPAGAPPHEITHSQPNGGPPNDNHHNQASGNSGDLAHGMNSPAPPRSSTPASTNSLSTYTNAMQAGASASAGAVYPGGVCAGYGCAAGGAKPVLWCAPPPGVNPHVYKSVQTNGADLPMNDVPTLRYYFNLGVECSWAAYGPPPHPHPPRHYSSRDLAQDMSQISLHERPVMPHGVENHNKHVKPGPSNDKPQLNNQGKGNGQRPLLGPRFKRGNNNQDAPNTNHNQAKHNSNMGNNKGPNNRRNSHTDSRNNGPPMGYNSGGGEGECVMEQPLLTLPYIPYPPPMYPIQYYPVETDPAMMGMMGGMGYVGYDDGVDYSLQPYFPPPPPPPHHYPPPHPTHPQHPTHPTHPTHPNHPNHPTHPHHNNEHK